MGLAFRLPGDIRDLDSFWELLERGGDAIRKRRYPRVPMGYPAREARYWGGYISDIDLFDAAFFKLSPREAELMDPQHRVFLETAWHALEDAGIAPSRLAGTRTGVYAGICNYDYGELQQAHRELAHSAHSALGTAPALLANRLSFLLDLRGPSQTIDTASSSSLVALHHGVQGLRQGACDQALVGGVNLLISSRIFDGFGDAGMLGRAGRCRTFDARADGYVRGEG
ncbi:MAG: polyketide synthase, partial [Myxococcota bacterium]